MEGLIIESSRPGKNNIGKLILIKVQQNGLIAATGYSNFLSIAPQLPNKLVRPDNFRF
jgi:hypothetical protein